MKALRIFYKDEQIIWTHGLEGSGEFPTTIQEDLTEHPIGTHWIEVQNSLDIARFMSSDDNRILEGNLIIGEPRPIIDTPSRPPIQEQIDQVTTRLEALETEKWLL